MVQTDAPSLLKIPSVAPNSSVASDGWLEMCSHSGDSPQAIPDVGLIAVGDVFVQGFSEAPQRFPRVSPTLQDVAQIVQYKRNSAAVI